jgi:transcriptional regulator with XRE-family HTH domain
LAQKHEMPEPRYLFRRTAAERSGGRHQTCSLTPIPKSSPSTRNVSESSQIVLTPVWVPVDHQIQLLRIGFDQGGSAVRATTQGIGRGAVHWAWTSSGRRSPLRGDIDNPIYTGLMEPASLIRTVRLRQGLSQAEIAQRAGTSQPVVSAYEHGRRDPSFQTLRKLVEAAGERVRLDATPSTSDLPPPGNLAEHGRRLLDVLSLSDAIPTRRRDPVLRAPRLVSK